MTQIAQRKTVGEVPCRSVNRKHSSLAVYRPLFDRSATPKPEVT